MAKKQQLESSENPLSRREREMMDILFRLGSGSVTDVRTEMAAPPSYSAVRSTLRILEGKGHLTHRHDGNRYVYLPTVELGAARDTAMGHLLETFFQNSTADAVTALLEERGRRLSTEELDRISELLNQAREEGR